MIIRLSSNIVSSIYVVLFDLLLAALVTWILQRLLSAWNLKRIYEDRKPIYLQETKYAAVVPQELSSAKAGLLAAASSTCIILLALAGSFSINGTSRPEVLSKQVPYLISGASGENIVDYREHFSAETGLVSGFFIFARSTLWCKTLRQKDSTIFAGFNSLEDLRTVKWPLHTELQNTTCVMELNGFENQPAVSEVYREIPNNFSCSFKVAETNFSEVMRVNGELNDECPFKVEETWCASYRTTFCVSLVKFDNLYTTFTIEEPHVDALPGTFIRGFDSSLLQAPVDSRVLRSMTYIMSIGLHLMPGDARTISMLSIYENAKVNEYSGETIRETEISTTLLLGTTLVSVLLTAILLIVSIAMQIMYVTKTGRREYNSFHSIRDLLSCALCEVHNDGTCRFQRKGGALLWVREGIPYLQSASEQRKLQPGKLSESDSHVTLPEWA